MANTPIVIEQEGRPLTTSRAVAEQFGKQHKHVLRDIETIKQNLTPQSCGVSPDLDSPIDDNFRSPILESEIDPASIEFFNQNFQLSSYIDTQGKEQPMYLMSKNGFTLLVMGYTGAKAMQFKVSYINAFDRMETMLKTGVSSIALQNIEKRLEALESTAGEGKHDADGAVVHSFLQAIKAALDSGEYYLEKKHAIKPEKPSHGEYLGYYDEFLITLQVTLAYEIYKRATSNPLSSKTLWDILCMADVMKVRNGRSDRKRTFHGKQVASMQIYKNKAPMIKCGGSKR